MIRATIGGLRRHCGARTASQEPAGGQQERDAAAGYCLARKVLTASAWDDDARILEALNATETTGEAIWAAAALLAVVKRMALDAADNDRAAARRILRRCANAVAEESETTLAQLRVVLAGAGVA